MQSPLEIKNYFEVLALRHKQIKKFHYGDFDDIVGTERANSDYPLLWLESAVIQPRDEDSFNHVFDFAFLVLMAAPTDDKERNLYNQEATFKIAQSILHKMMQDAEDNIIEMEINDCEYQPVIRAVGNNNETGWRIPVRLYGYTDTCVNESDWNNLFPDGAMAKFSYSVKDGDLILINESLPSGWEYGNEWNIYMDGELTIIPREDEVNMKFVGEYCVVEFKISTEGSTWITCSAIIGPDDNEGFSIPIKYNPKI